MQVHVGRRTGRAWSRSTRRRRPPPTELDRRVDLARMASTNSLCFSTYFSSGMWPSCQSPYISLPMAQNFTPYGSRVAVLRAQLAHRRRRRRRWRTRRPRRPTCASPRPVLTAMYGSAPISRHKVHELVEADVVGLDALPGRVLARRPAVAVADAVLPVVAADEVAARPAVDGRVELAQERQRVGAASRGRCRPASARRRRSGACPCRCATISSRPLSVVPPARKRSGWVVALLRRGRVDADRLAHRSRRRPRRG